MVDCIVLTQEKYLSESDGGWYANNVLLEQQRIMEALKKKGLSVVKKSWDDDAFDWSNAKAVLIREVWDYFNRYAEFEKAIRNISQKTKLINPVEQVIWNTDKHYMIDLAKKNVPIIPSHFIEKPTREN
jgi:glutathione synthase/RimK-type ligase-like ATP-grasp enzyme